MPRNPSTGVFDRVSNSFSHPVYGTVIDPTGAESLFDDYDGGLNDFQNVDMSGALATASGSTTARNFADRAADVVNVIDFGAVGDGVTNDSPAIAASFTAANGRCVFIPTGTYKLDTDVTPSGGNVSVLVDPGATFIGSGLLKLDNVIPLQDVPIMSNDAVSRSYTTSDITGYDNQFLFARQATIADAGCAAVAVMGQGSANGSGASAFGGNFLGQVTADGGTAIGTEIDCGIRGSATSGNVYGLVIAAAGNAQPRAAIQIQTHSSTTKFVDGQIFAFNGASSSGCVTGALIKAVGVSASAGSCQRFFYVSPEISATTAEIDIPSLFVGATPDGVANRLSITGSASSGGPVLVPIGTDANISMSIRSKGTGVVQFITNGNESFRVASTAGVDSLVAEAGTGTATLSARGTSSDVNISLVPRGAGNVLLPGAPTTDLAASTKKYVDDGLATKQAQDADLQALADNSTNGLWARTGSGTGAARTLTGTTRKVTVTNGDGVSGNPTVTLPSVIEGMPVVVAASGAASAAHTGTTTETIILTVAVPGNSLGPNGYVDVEFDYSYSNNANNKIARVKYGGSTLVGLTTTTNANNRASIRIQNRNSTSSQASGPNTSFGAGSSLNTSSIDSTASQNITITFELANTGDSMVLERYVISTCYVT